MPSHYGPWIQPPDQTAVIVPTRQPYRLPYLDPPDPTIGISDQPAIITVGSTERPAPGALELDYFSDASAYVYLAIGRHDDRPGYGWWAKLPVMVFDVGAGLSDPGSMAPVPPSPSAIAAAGATGYQLEAPAGTYLGGGFDVVAGPVNVSAYWVDGTDNKPAEVAYGDLWTARLQIRRLLSTAYDTSDLVPPNQWPADLVGTTVLYDEQIAGSDSDLTVISNGGINNYVAMNPRRTPDWAVHFADADLDGGQRLGFVATLGAIASGSWFDPPAQYLTMSWAPYSNGVEWKALFASLVNWELSWTYRPPRYRFVYEGALLLQELPPSSAIAEARPQGRLRPPLHIPRRYLPGPIEDGGDGLTYAAPIVISGGAGERMFSTAGASLEDPDHQTFYGNGHLVWFRWIAPRDGMVTFSTAATLPPRWDSTLAVWVEDVTWPTSPPIVSGDDEDLQPGVSTADGFGTSAVTFAATAGTVYRVQVDSYDYGVFGSNPPAGFPRPDCVLTWSMA